MPPHPGPIELVVADEYMKYATLPCTPLLALPEVPSEPSQCDRTGPATSSFATHGTQVRHSARAATHAARAGKLARHSPSGHTLVLSARLTRRLIKRALFAAFAVVFVLSALLVAVNVYLNGEYLPRLIKSEQSFVTVEYRLAWTVWPGHVNLEGLKVHGDERTFAWDITADGAKIVADISALTDRKIELERLELKGVTAHVRPRLHYLDADADYLAALPQVNMGGSSLLAEGPQPPVELRREKDPWTVRIDQARVTDLNGLWVDRFRFIGRADAQGSVALDEGRVLTTGPLKISLHEGVVSVDGATTLRNLEGGGTSQLGPVDLTAARGWGLLSTLSGDTSLKGEVVELAFLPKLPGLPVPLELQGAQGPISTTVSMKDGAVLPGAVLEWEAKNASVKLEGFHARGAMTLHAKVDHTPSGLRTLATATFSDFWLGREWKPPLSTAKKMVLELVAPNVDLGRASRFDQDLRAMFANEPAKLTVEEARLLGEERALQWEATADVLTASVDLSKAEARELSLVDTRTSGVRVRLRPRVTQAEATPVYLKHLPPIDGLPSPPLRAATAPIEPEAERAAQNPWSIRAEDALVEDLRELWLEAFRFEGRATVRGGFHYEAGGRLSLGPLRTQLHDGTVQVARWKAVSKLSGKIDAELKPVDLEAQQGPSFFRTFGAKSEVQGQLEDVNFIRHFPSVPIPAELQGGQGGIRARITVKDGVVQSGSEVHWDTRSLQASVHDYRFVGPFSLDARWSDSRGGPRMFVEGHVSPYRVTRVTEEKPLLGGKLISWRMEAPAFDLAHPTFEPMTYGEVHDGTVPDLSVLNAFVPDNLPLKMEKGSGTFTGKVWFTHKYQAWAEFKVGGIGAQLVYDKVFVKGDWSCQAKLANVNLNTGAGDITSALVLLNNMAMREGSRSHDPWFGRLEMTKGSVRPKEALLLSGDVDTTMRDGRPLIAFMAAETDLLPAWARSLVTLNALRATGKFRLGKDRIEVDSLNARGQSVEIRGRMRKQGTRQWADMLLVSRGQQVGVALRGTRVEFKILGAAAWFREQMLAPKW